MPELSRHADNVREAGVEETAPAFRTHDSSAGLRSFHFVLSLLVMFCFILAAFVWWNLLRDFP